MRIFKSAEGQWFHYREFLNLPGWHSVAVVLGIIRVDNDWVDSQLIVTDCDRKVVLDVSVHDAESRQNSVHKLRTLAAACSGMADWIEGPGADLFAEIEARKGDARLRSRPYEG